MRLFAFVIFVFASLVCAAALQQPTNRSLSQRDRTSKTQSSFDIQEAAKRVASVVVVDEAGRPAGQGSGFFVDSQGTLITNYHVIEKASGALVKTSGGAFYVVEGVLAEDAKHDLAVLKVAGRNFAFLPLGDSTKVKVGDRVIAIGSPLGLESTVSDGIVSGRRGESDSEVIQTSAPISPGSSGGVLLNSRGEVIGVTTFMIVAGQNLNFAIPSNYIRPLLAAGSAHPFHPTPAPKTSVEQQTTAPIRVVAASVTESVPTDCNAVPPSSQSVFLTNIAKLWVSFLFLGGYKGGVGRVEWINPEGAVYHFSPFIQTNTSDTHHYCYYIYIAGHAAEKMPGMWKVRVTWDGTEVALEKFELRVFHDLPRLP